VGTEFTLEEAGSPLRPTLATLEEQYVRRVLDEVRGDKVAAAGGAAAGGRPAREAERVSGRMGKGRSAVVFMI